jgi:hypothetical protein
MFMLPVKKRKIFINVGVRKEVWSVGLLVLQLLLMTLRGVTTAGNKELVQDDLSTHCKIIFSAQERRKEH